MKGSCWIGNRNWLAGRLQRLRGEIMESLKRSADVRAWAARFPWPTLGAAAVAGIGAGWAVGNATRRQTPEEAAFEGQSPAAQEAEAAHPAGRLVSGLGTIVGAFASAAMGAATQAVTAAIKETIHESLHPEPGEEEEEPPAETHGQ